MALTPRDKTLALVLPAAGVALVYGLMILPDHRAKVTAAEKAAAAATAQVPTEGEVAARRARLAAATAEAAAEANRLADLRPRPDALTAEIAAGKQDLAEARKALDPAAHRAALTRADADHQAALKRALADHRAGLARLWAETGRPGASRPDRIGLLNKVLARYALTVLDATDDAKAAPLPPGLAAVLPAAAEADGKAPPRLREVRVRGRYAEVAGALDAIARGDAWAVPVGLTMKDPGDDDGRLEWVLQVWV